MSFFLAPVALHKKYINKYVTKYIIWNTAFADREISWCMRTNEPSAGYKGISREEDFSLNNLNFKKEMAPSAGFEPASQP